MAYARVLWMCMICFGAGTAVSAQDRYDRFVGEYSAALQIAEICVGLSTSDVERAASIAESQEGLRGSRILRMVQFGRSDQLNRLGLDQLSARGLDPNKRAALCRFGKSVAEKDDQIGRFLEAQ